MEYGFISSLMAHFKFGDFGGTYFGKISRKLADIMKINTREFFFFFKNHAQKLKLAKKNLKSFIKINFI